MLLQRGPQVNKFEQVSSDDHQMSVAAGGSQRVPGLMSSGVRLGAGPLGPIQFQMSNSCVNALQSV